MGRQYVAEDIILGMQHGMVRADVDTNGEMLELFVPVSVFYKAVHRAMQLQGELAREKRDSVVPACWACDKGPPGNH